MLSLPIEMKSHLLSACIWPASPAKKSNPEVNNSTLLLLQLGRIDFACCWPRVGRGRVADLTSTTQPLANRTDADVLLHAVLWSSLSQAGFVGRVQGKVRQTKDCRGRPRNFPAGLRLAEVTNKSNCCSYSCWVQPSCLPTGDPGHQPYLKLLTETQAGDKLGQDHKYNQLCPLAAGILVSGLGEPAPVPFQRRRWSFTVFLQND